MIVRPSRRTSPQRRRPGLWRRCQHAAKSEQRAYAFPFKEFWAEPSERSQASLTRQYERALADGDVVVFIRDNEHEKLVSYSVALQPDAESHVNIGDHLV